MAYIHFDSTFAPCAFLIVKTDGDPYKENDTILVQTDYDYPGVARNMGWDMGHSLEEGKPWGECSHSGTDGTIKCVDCGKPSFDFIAQAYDYIQDHKGEEYPELNEYFSGA